MASHPNRDQLSIQNQKNRRLTTVAPGCGGCCRRRGALGCNLMGLFAEPRRPARASPDRAELLPPPTHPTPAATAPDDAPCQRPPAPPPHSPRYTARKHAARPLPGTRAADRAAITARLRRGPRLGAQLTHRSTGESTSCALLLVVVVPREPIELVFASRFRHRLPRVGRGAGANNRTHASQISGDTTTAEAKI